MATQNSGDKKNINELLKEKDAFLTTSEKCYEFFLSHTRGLIMAGVVLVLMIVAIAMYLNYQEKAEIQAVVAYENALSLVGANQQNLAIPITALEKIRLDYKQWKVSRLAAFDLVSLYGAKGDSARALGLAEELLHSLKQGEMSLKPLLLNTLGGLYEVNGDYVKATKSYEALLGLTGIIIPQLKEDVLLSLGRVTTEAGQTEEALKYYQAILTEFPQSYGAFWANYQIAKLKGQAVAFPLVEIETATVASAKKEAPPAASEATKNSNPDSAKALKATGTPQDLPDEPVKND